MAHPERVPRAAAVRMVRSYLVAPGFAAVNDAMRAGRFLGGDGHRGPGDDRLVRRTTGSSRRPRAMPVRAREVVLEDCGHIPMYDDPDAVARLLLDGSGG